MPTEKPRFSITVDQNLSDAIDDYKYRTRAKNQTQAVVELIELGLDSIEQKTVETKKSPAPEGTEDEEQAIDELEEELRSVLLKHGLLQGGDITPDQNAFLKHVFALILAYFQKSV